MHVEPDGDGYRVRMSTTKGNIVPVTIMGAAFTFISVLMFISAMSEANGWRLVIAGAVAAMFGGVGLRQIGFVRASLPRWAEDRAAQMEGLAERIPKLLRD